MSLLEESPYFCVIEFWVLSDAEKALGLVVIGRGDWNVSEEKKNGGCSPNQNPESRVCF